MLLLFVTVKEIREKNKNGIESQSKKHKTVIT